MASPLVIDITNSSKNKDTNTNNAKTDLDKSDITGMLKLGKGDVSGVIKYQAASQLINQGISIAKGIYAYNLSRTSLQDGNSFTQRNLENNYQMTTNMLNATMGIAMGFAMGGVAGGLVSTGVMVSNIIFTEVKAAQDYDVSLRKENLASGLNRGNLGTILTNGSR